MQDCAASLQVYQASKALIVLSIGPDNFDHLVKSLRGLMSIVSLIHKPICSTVLIAIQALA